MASPPTHPYTKRRSPPPPPPPPPSRPKPTTGGGFFYKFVLFALFLLAVPLFPSQAPDFVAETVFTKFWELIHLLFVGIAVAYGLFSRRNVESGVVSNTSRVVVDESSLSYVSRIFPVSSVFDEEFDNSCDFVDVRSENVTKTRVVESELRGEVEEEEVNEVRAWNSQYFQGRSKVVVARPAYGLDGHVVHQPLGLPVRSLRSSLRDNVAPEDVAVNGNVESLVEEGFEEVIAAPPSPVVPWDMMGMVDGYPSNFQPLSVDETQFTSLKSDSSRSSVSSSSQNGYVSHSQNRFSPSRSVSEQSLNSNVEEPVKERSPEDSPQSSSPSLPPSPPLSLAPPSPPAPPSPEVVIDDTQGRVSHSRHYSDGSLVEDNVRRGFEDELEGSNVRGRRKKELGSKPLNSVNAESSRRRNKSRRSYPPESLSSPADDTTTRRRHLHQKSEESLGKGLESDFNNHRIIKKGRSQDSLELPPEDSVKDKKFSESFPPLDVLFQPTNAKASRRAMRSSRGDHDTLPERVVTRRNSENDSIDFDKSKKKDLAVYNKELKSNSLGSEPQSWRSSSKVPLQGKSVRTIRSDRHGKERKTEEDSSDDRAEAKLETRGRTKSRRQRQEELAIVLHQEKTPEPPPVISEPEYSVVEETEVPQPQVTLEEEEEADHNEVDRKAGEFIAKFREQIRLQKLTSGEQPRGGGGSTSIMRERHFR